MDVLGDCTPISTTRGVKASQIPLWVEPDHVEAQTGAECMVQAQRLFPGW